MNKFELLSEFKTFQSLSLQFNKCKHVLNQAIIMVQKQNELTEDEIQTILFAVSRLFKLQNNELRRLMFALISQVESESLFMFTQQLIKDITGSNQFFKAQSLVLIPNIINENNIGSLERYIKISTVDQNEYVQQCAIHAVIETLIRNKQMIQHFQDVQQDIQKAQGNNQYLSLILQGYIKNQSQKIIMIDDVNVLVGLQQIKIIQQQLQHKQDPNLINLLQNAIYHKIPMIQFQACCVFIQLNISSNSQMVQVYDVLYKYLDEQDIIQTIYALRLINKMMQNKERRAIIKNQSKLQELSNSSNKSVQNLATQILFKLSNNNNIQQLLEQIRSKFSSMSEEFKTDIVTSIKMVALNCQNNCQQILNFLQLILKTAGKKNEFKYKTIQTIEFIIKNVQNNEKQGLQILIQIIEDCSDKNLLLRILNLIYENVQFLDTSSLLALQNRFILENSEIQQTVYEIFKKCELNMQGINDFIQVNQDSYQSFWQEKKLQDFYSDDFMSQLQQKMKSQSEINIEELQSNLNQTQYSQNEIQQYEDPEFQSYGMVYNVEEIKNLEDGEDIHIKYKIIHFKQHIIIEYHIQNKMQLVISDLQFENTFKYDNLQLDIQQKIQELKPDQQFVLKQGFLKNNQVVENQIMSLIRFKVKAKKVYEEDYEMENIQIKVKNQLKKRTTNIDQFKNDKIDMQKIDKKFKLPFENAQFCKMRITEYFNLFEVIDENDQNLKYLQLFMSGKFGEQKVLMEFKIVFDINKGCIIQSIIYGDELLNQDLIQCIKFIK